MENENETRKGLEKFSDKKFVQVSERAFMANYMDVIVDPFVLTQTALMQFAKCSPESMSTLLAYIGAMLMNKYFGKPEDEK